MEQHASKAQEAQADHERIEREALDWLVRFTSGEATPTDLRAGKAWCARDPAHAEAFKRVSRMWETLGPDAFSAVAPVRRPVLSRRALLTGGAAAAVAASAAYVVVRPPLGLWPSFSEMTADYRTRTGERRKVALADNVSVDMNTQTSIAMRGRDADGAGIELISGEAMISAAAERPVTVTSGNGEAVGHQARFNVRNDGRSVCVTCVDGRVTVSSAGQTVSLQPREQVTYDPRGLGKAASIDPSIVTAWQNDLLIFHATPLREVVAEINRYRSGKIIVTNPALGGRLFSANFRIRNADHIVEQVQKLFGATVTSLPGGLILLS
jgi:transmembrane sensor